jgi:hypothetical protein
MVTSRKIAALIEDFNDVALPIAGIAALVCVIAALVFLI